MKFPKLQGTERNTQINLEEYRWYDVVVPRDYETNGQDSPRWTWIFGYPPFKPLYSPAYLVHDYLMTKAFEESFTVEVLEEAIKAANKEWAAIMRKVEPSKRTEAAIWCLNTYWKYRMWKGI